MLMVASHCAYSRHSGIIGKPFPLVEMLSVYGRKGYLFSAGLLYLAILTTLTSLLYTLRGAACKVSGRTDVQRLLTLGAPLAVSGAGFSQIVDRLYAPAGLVCLAVVFLPMALCAAEKRKQLLLDNSGRSKYDENICMNKCTTERSCC